MEEHGILKNSLRSRAPPPPPAEEDSERLENSVLLSSPPPPSLSPLLTRDYCSRHQKKKRERGTERSIKKGRFAGFTSNLMLVLRTFSRRSQRRMGHRTLDCQLLPLCSSEGQQPAL